MISVVDEMPGTGKSTALLREINNSPNKNYIWVSPLLTEAGTGVEGSLGRVQKEAPNLNFVAPSSSHEGSKLGHLKHLLKVGENVSITHSLFMMITKDMVADIEGNEYHVIIDETIDKVYIHNKGGMVEDIVKFIDLKVVEVHEHGRLKWVGPSFSTHTEEKDLCDEGLLYLHQGSLLVKRYASVVYEVALSVTILTYLFRASPMRMWLDACRLPWEYREVPLRASSDDLRGRLKGLIHIEPQDLTISRWQEKSDTIFSSTWYKEASEEQLAYMSDLNSRLYDRWRRRNEVQLMFSVFKDYADKVAGRGCKQKNHQDPNVNFVPKNARATNQHDTKSHVLYEVNVYPLVDVERYLNHIVPSGVLDRDLFSLSEMIQVVFRSRIRKGEPINLYISSDRMRRLFEDWLDGKITHK